MCCTTSGMLYYTRDEIPHKNMIQTISNALNDLINHNKNLPTFSTSKYNIQIYEFKNTVYTNIFQMILMFELETGNRPMKISVL